MSVTVATVEDIERIVASLADRPTVLAVDRRTAARMLSVSDSTFGRLVKAGHLPAVPHVNPPRYSVRMLEDFVSAGTSSPAGTPPPTPAGLDGPSGSIATDLSGSVAPLPHLRSSRAGDRQGPQSTASPGPSGDAA